MNRAHAAALCSSEDWNKIEIWHGKNVRDPTPVFQKLPSLQQREKLHNLPPSDSHCSPDNFHTVPWCGERGYTVCLVFLWRRLKHRLGLLDRPLGKSCNDLSVCSLRREVQSMNWPGLLITAPFATVRRNQLCQVFKARDKAAVHYTEQTHFIDPKSHHNYKSSPPS